MWMKRKVRSSRLAVRGSRLAARGSQVAGGGSPFAARVSRAGASPLSHVDPGGRLRMVDVSDKAVTAREAVARGRITMSRDAAQAVRQASLKKGDALAAARLAGIMAAKRTADLIPLCHPVPLSHVEVTLTPNRNGYDIEARARTDAKTGVEMEALTAVSVAALTIYDMVKAVDKGMIIGDIRLVAKRGGRSGDYTA
jgi:cyclic pyranopterin monophosphate synthase